MKFSSFRTILDGKDKKEGGEAYDLFLGRVKKGTHPVLDAINHASLLESHRKSSRKRKGLLKNLRGPLRKKAQFRGVRLNRRYPSISAGGVRRCSCGGRSAGHAKEL